MGGRIKQRREELGMEQAALCALVPGLTQQALSNLETRDSKTSELAFRIADALRVSARWLLDGTGKPTDRDWPFERVVRARWDDLTEGDRGYVEGAINRALDDCEARAKSVAMAIGDLGANLAKPLPKGRGINPPALPADAAKLAEEASKKTSARHARRSSRSAQSPKAGETPEQGT